MNTFSSELKKLNRSSKRSIDQVLKNASDGIASKNESLKVRSARKRVYEENKHKISSSSVQVQYPSTNASAIEVTPETPESKRQRIDSLFLKMNAKVAELKDCAKDLSSEFAVDRSKSRFWSGISDPNYGTIECCTLPNPDIGDSDHDLMMAFNAHMATVFKSFFGSSRDDNFTTLRVKETNDVHY